MRQIAVLVEGSTEEAFVGRVLAPYLRDSGADAYGIRVETSRSAAGHKFAGGGNWEKYERNLRKLLGQSHWSLVTTLMDFYGYPGDGPRADCCHRPHRPRDCVARREQAIADAIDSRRFVPFIMLHEFETMVYAAALAGGPVLGSVDLGERLRRDAQQVGDDVELINDSPQTAPSKRISRHQPAYAKVTDGLQIIEDAGLDRVLQACPGLARWVQRIIDS